MATKKSRLVFGIAEGRGFYIGDRKFVIERIHSAGRATVTEDKGWCIEKKELFKDTNVELVPEVSVHLGNGSIGMVKVVFEAPRTIVIDRDAEREAGLTNAT